MLPFQPADVVANFCHAAMLVPMSTMNISLPDYLKSFVDEQVAGRGYGTSSEYGCCLTAPPLHRLNRPTPLISPGCAIEFVVGRASEEQTDYST